MNDSRPSTIFWTYGVNKAAKPAKKDLNIDTPLRLSGSAGEHLDTDPDLDFDFALNIP